MLILLLFLVIACLGLITMYKYLQLQSIERENALMDSYMESMKQFYQALSNRSETIQRYRHDLANHIQTLEMLSVNPEQASEITKYMEGLTEQYAQLQSERYCSNDIINSILTIKEQQCIRKYIPLKLQIEDYNYAEIQDFDLVSFLHNLFDNAIEANSRISASDPHGITFRMGMDSHSIWIIMENHVVPHTEVSFKTQKSHSEHHGFGTKIIDSIVTKYQGQHEISLDKDYFTLLQKFVFPINTALKEN